MLLQQFMELRLPMVLFLSLPKTEQEGKPRLNYQFYQGFMTPTIIPEVTNAAEYATMLSEYQVCTGQITYLY